ncbi:MAG TPA: low molecular weight protein-tyrosine-phosphatase [Arachnia sp.]|nr:low molecular weight protein-tyrosine-phosphatase [Arachnia sp.]
MSTILFVCWGNICRSPMAERVARRRAEERGLDVRIASFGVSSDEVGNPIDHRAARTLERAGYDASGHHARKIGAADIKGAQLVVAAEPLHVARLQRIAPCASNIVLLNDFNPDKAKGEPLTDPWYGTDEGFEETLADIEAAVDGVLQAVTRN